LKTEGLLAAAEKEEERAADEETDGVKEAREEVDEDSDESVICSSEKANAMIEKIS
jgi:hypothetical protein